MRRSLYSSAMISVLALLFFSCAELQKQVTLDGEKKESIVEMRMSNFKFEPNNILTYEGNTVLIRIKNVTISEHNFTLTDPSGTKIEEIDVPRDETVEVKITFQHAGVYHFYCDRPFHSAFGMKGQVEVLAK